MTQITLEQDIDHLYGRVRKRWYRAQHDPGFVTWANGFRIFMTPAWPEPPLMILGIQPGGDASPKHKKPGEHFRPPRTSDYLDQPWQVCGCGKPSARWAKTICSPKLWAPT